jgi:hypothetical protein
MVLKTASYCCFAMCVFFLVIEVHYCFTSAGGDEWEQVSSGGGEGSGNAGGGGGGGGDSGGGGGGGGDSGGEEGKNYGSS